jgi:hypothetical protein
VTKFPCGVEDCLAQQGVPQVAAGVRAAVSPGVCGGLLLAASILRAQDTRTVTEPTIPPSCITLGNVFLNQPGAIKVSARFAETALGPGPVNFLPAGEDVTVSRALGKGAANACSAKFVPMPE